MRRFKPPYRLQGKGALPTVNKPQNLELLAQHGVNTFDITFLDKPGGVPIQPSRNNDLLNVFDPTNVNQNTPIEFITVSVKVWDVASSTLIVPPGGSNPPLVASLRYAGTTGKFLVDFTGQNTVLSANLVNQRWAIVWDTEINGFPFRAFEFFTVLPDGDVAFNDVITIADVLAPMTTALDGGTVQSLLDQSTSWAIGRLKRKHGMNPLKIDLADESLREGIIFRTRWLVFTYDLSAGFKVAEASEGLERVKFAGRNDAALERLLDEAKENVDAYGSQNAPGRKPSITAITSDVGYTRTDGPAVPFWFPGS